MEIGDQTHRHLPLRAGLSTPCYLPLGATLVTQFAHEITEGEAGEESRSSANYLILHVYFFDLLVLERLLQRWRVAVAHSEDTDTDDRHAGEHLAS